MIHFLSLVLAVTAFAALALSMKRHQRDLAGRTLSEREAGRLRIGGWALIALILAIDIFAFGFGYALVAWAGHLTMGAWLNVAWLCWKSPPPRSR
ncbi:DUF3325 domain-containing protein [Novosphingobium lindaniclasticum]|uniref:DUF3325 domain-containing protein n=1 Tax=Novosphingobium lindaniclasticum LE124 TaxID=1096930 RepID=T0HKB1_9SPHN|nr:DUF3325 family protein [Novosphingobium lindaniclasticum]EQB13442.1 hypothetical protein L284_14215 [Novosphingobium lindaniclasticum LE124]